MSQTNAAESVLPDKVTSFVQKLLEVVPTEYDD